MTAQLRPVEPTPWEALDDGRPRLRVGAGAFGGQRASLAGTEGTLLELGIFEGTWPLGRVLLQLRGTALRVFSDESVYAAPVDAARPPDGHRRKDTGEHAVSTLVLLTDVGSPLEVGLRFGVRLPTTDDAVGLGRDRTDFYSTLGARWRSGAVELRGDAGVGVFGTRDPAREQVDPILLAGGALLDVGPLRLGVWGLGQHDTRSGTPLRGTEDLGELRVSVELGRQRRLRAVFIRGFTPHSPAGGLLIDWGFRF